MKVACETKSGVSERCEDLRWGRQRLLLLLLQLLLEELDLVLLWAGDLGGGWLRRRRGDKDRGVEQEGGAVQHLQDETRGWSLRLSRQQLQLPRTRFPCTPVGQAAAQWQWSWSSNSSFKHILAFKRKHVWWIPAPRFISPSSCVSACHSVL